MLYTTPASFLFPIYFGYTLKVFNYLGGKQMQKNVNNGEEVNVSFQNKVEEVWQKTCGSWENCNESTIQALLSGCFEQSIDPQFCMSWVEKHKEKIPDWSTVSKKSLNWINEHTSTGSPYSESNFPLQ
jgi:hypothetical protein